MTHHFEVDTNAGTIQHPSVTVPLQRDPAGDPVPGTGLKIQPVSLFVLQGLTKDMNNCVRKGVKAFANELGKEPHNLTPQEVLTANAVATIDDAIIERIKSLLLDRLVGWDEGLVSEKGEPLAPDVVVTAGADGESKVTVKDMFVESIVRSTPMVAIAVLAEASNAGVEIEGESTGTSDGNGASADTPAESTASGNTSPEKQTGQQTNADSSEVEPVPA